MTEEQDKTGSLRALVERWNEAAGFNEASAKAKPAESAVYTLRAQEQRALAAELERTLDALPPFDGAAIIDRLRRTLRIVQWRLDDAQYEVERALDSMGDVAR